jgi:hypothetical protein
MCKRGDCDEPPSDHAMFYQVTCEIENAFKMLYNVATRKKCASGIWLGERFEVKLITAWFFGYTAHKAMQSSGYYP